MPKSYIFDIRGVEHKLHRFGYLDGSLNRETLGWAISVNVNREAELKECYGTCWQVRRDELLASDGLTCLDVVWRPVWDPGDFVAAAIIEKLERDDV